jgi:hypothetical protein
MWPGDGGLGLATLGVEPGCERDACRPWSPRGTGGRPCPTRYHEVMLTVTGFDMRIRAMEHY